MHTNTNTNTNNTNTPGRSDQEEDRGAKVPEDGGRRQEEGAGAAEEGGAGGDRQDQQESLHARSHHRLECGPDLNKFW